jgi:hypothetical protein
VRLDGAREFTYAVKTSAAALVPLITTFHREASEMIADETRRRMSEQFVTPASERSGRLLGSVKAKHTPTEINVQIGGGDILHAGWWEFGGDTNSPVGNTQREFIPGGRSLYPAAAAKRDEIDVMAMAVVTKIEGILGRG